MLATHREFNARCASGPFDAAQGVQRWSAEQVVPVGQRRRAAVRSKQELHQVVRPYGDEISIPHQLRKLEQQAWHLDHAADAERGTGPDLGSFGQQQGFGRAEFGNVGDHREHDAERAPGGSKQQGTELTAQ